MRWNTSSRWMESALRIMVNMSPGTDVSTSTDRLGRKPRSSVACSTGVPWPMIIST